MTAVQVLNQVIKAGGRIIHDSDRPRLMIPPYLRPIVQEHRKALRFLVAESSVLATAYRRYWEARPGSQPLETFRTLYLEIARLEQQTPAEIAWHTLRYAAIAYHAESGICPFCQQQGSLHLPAERINEELPVQGIESADVCKN